jgi:hypothetical protein
MNEDDEIIEVKLPRSDYLVLRKMIDDQTALSGAGKWLKQKLQVLFWLAAGVLSIVGLYTYFKGN